MGYIRLSLSNKKTGEIYHSYLRHNIGEDNEKISDTDTFLLIALGSLSACGGGGSGNITAESVTIVTANPKIANPMKAKITLTSDQIKTDVPVSLYAIDKTADPNIEARQIPLGTVLIKIVNFGTHDYEMDVIIPATVEFAGSYYLSAVVDPLDVVSESNKDDNSAATEMTLADSTGVNIILSNFDLDHTALLINTDDYVTPTVDNKYNADAGGTITVGADGLKLGESVDIDAFASLRISRNDKGTSIDMPLYLWDTSIGRYTNAYNNVDPSVFDASSSEWLPMGQFTPLLAETAGGVASLDDIRRDSEHMAFYFPGKLGSTLAKALRKYCPPGAACLQNVVPDPTIPPPDLSTAWVSYLENYLSDLNGGESANMAKVDFAICVKIKPRDPAIVDPTEDNEVCKPLAISLPPPKSPATTTITSIGSYELTHYKTLTNPIDKSGGLATKNSNPYFSFHLDFGAGLSMNERGFVSYISGDLPVRILGKDYPFAGMKISAQLVPDYYNKPAEDVSGYSTEMYFLGMVIATTPPTKPIVQNITGNLSDLISNPLIPEDKELFSKETPPWSQQFFVGPVPLVAEASVGGTIAITADVGFSDSTVAFAFEAGPDASLDAGLSVGVGIKGITVGVEGTVHLLEEKILLSTGINIEVFDDGMISHNVEFAIIPGIVVKNVFTGPVGELGLFVEYPTFTRSTCQVGIIKYKCFKFEKEHKTWNLYTSPALFKLDDILFEIPVGKVVDVVKVEGYPTTYLTSQ